MRSISKWLVAVTTAISLVGGYQSASAGFIGMPSMLGSITKRISFGNFTLPPMAYTQFCLRYTDQCKSNQIVFRGGPVRLTAERWEDLREVNRDVNVGISPEANLEGLAGEKWLINPSSGDCNDYAVSKRSELSLRPSSCLASTPSGRRCPACSTCPADRVGLHEKKPGEVWSAMG